MVRFKKIVVFKKFFKTNCKYRRWLERKVRDSCGSSGTDETPQARRGGSAHAPRNASILEWKSTNYFFYSNKVYENNRKV